MSVWDRVKRLMRSEKQERAVEQEPPEEASERRSPPPAVDDEPVEESSRTRFEALIESAAPDDALAEELFQRVSAEGFEDEARELSLRLLDRHPGLNRLRLRLGLALVSRGDDTLSQAVLLPLADDVNVSVEALAAIAEIAERAGDAERALAFYERVLAVDMNYPNARERVTRLRAAGSEKAPVAGVTLLASGAKAAGRYEILREIGRGGAGTVFAAVDQQLKRRVALKIYHQRSGRELERLRHEARYPAQLEHPGVIRIFDVDEKLGAIAMEWAYGGALKSRVERGDLSASQIAQCLGKVASALLAVHAQGLVHRDIKPSNILLRGVDEPVLADFGLALPADASPQLLGDVGEGTVGFMPPEQRVGEVVLPSADVYALAATVRELFRSGAVECPSGLEETLITAMEPEPTARPSMSEMQTALLAVG